MSEISSATVEQANGIDEMSQAVAHMDEMTQQNAALAEESAASAGFLATQTQTLTDLVGTFRIARTGSGPVAAMTAAPARKAAAPDAGPGPRSEPDRLRRLAAQAFSSAKDKPASRTPSSPPARSPAPARPAATPARAMRSASGSAKPTSGWEEF